MHFQEGSSCSYLHHLEEILELAMVRIMNPLLHPDWVYRWTSMYRAEEKALKEFHQPAKNIQLLMRKSSPTLIEDYMTSMKRIGHVDIEMFENDLSGLIYAGHETSAITISNTLLLLAMHPDVQDQAVAEIRQHCGTFDEDISYETLQQLVYIEMVLKESLRLFPIAPIIARQPTHEIALGKYTVPAGVDVLLNIFNIHRNPVYWGEDAEHFRPERFATTYDRSAYLPFSAGMRNCVGAQHAMVSMKIMLIKILTSYRLKTDLKINDLSMKFVLTMKIGNGYMVRLTRS
ncbi:cytochrome P450 3A19-like [Anopheles darlingi]|uniref:cytochrome P450 3A19-like n=1 Tax=Anopheles darlingi TaxID=43151 RepID=UPI002100617B|nr:cytochrome P450 3A19-like [Anopheles darlingi]